VTSDRGGCSQATTAGVRTAFGAFRCEAWHVCAFISPDPVTEKPETLTDGTASFAETPTPENAAAGEAITRKTAETRANLSIDASVRRSKQNRQPLCPDACRRRATRNGTTGARVVRKPNDTKAERDLPGLLA
jgi:hypothetical protein